jgi:cation:H+ antiporter
VLIPLLSLAAGILLLYLGGEGLVRGASGLAARFGVDPLFVGLTVVAFGTSAPELAVSLRAALGGLDDVALGNVVGSNVANIGLILGIATLIRPVRVASRLVRFDGPFMVAISVLVALFVIYFAGIPRGAGGLLVALLVGYIVLRGRIARRDARVVTEQFEHAAETRSRALGLLLLLVVGGFVGLVAGARLFVDGAVAIAEALAVPPAIIGLSVVAFGTSLPELAASLVAALRGEGDMAAGNVVGSNIFNLLSILGITALVTPLERGGIALEDLVAMLLFAFASLWLMRTGHRVSRLEGGLMLAGYLVYLGLLVARVG